MNLSLLTDLYELTMMQGYFFSRPEEEAVFEMFFRRQPFNGGFTVFAGLWPLLETIQEMRFTDNEIGYLQSLNTFKEEFLAYLRNFRFQGDIYSVSEGSIIFPLEPILRVHGNLAEAQFIESILLNYINFQSLIATKSARIASIAGDKPVMEFGLRRAHGINGALMASRAAYIGGASATSNTLAGSTFGIPVSGTMAHSWVMNFDSELEAFEKYSALYPDRSVLLVDTFDTLKSGIPNAITVFKKLKKNQPALMAVRIDSGDLEYLSKNARRLLDREGLEEVKIFVSSDLDEWIIRQLIDSGSPIDAWGVGTRLVTGWNDPALTGVYKIVAIKSRKGYEPRIKISNQAEKITNPGVKNIIRFYNGNSQALADLIVREDEIEEIKVRVSRHEPIRFHHPATDYERFILSDYSSVKILLEPVMQGGKIIGKDPPLSALRAYRENEIGSLDDTFKRLLNPHIYKISLSDRLKSLKTELIKKIKSDYDDNGASR